MKKKNQGGNPMKPWSILTAILILSITAAAIKIQTGRVRELNSNKKGIPGVQIIFQDAKSTDSDGAGNFRLVFQDKQPGQLIFMEKIYKTGYELVNEKDFDIVKISAGDRLGVDIIMAVTGTVAAAKREYYNVSDKALRQGFGKEIRDLRLRLQNARLSRQEFREKYDALLAQFESQKKELDRLAEKFARVNFDDVGALYREALALFKKGRIDEAIKKLENADLPDRTARRPAERDRIDRAGQELARQKEENEKGLQEDIQAMQLQAQMYGLKFEIAKAEALYGQLLRCAGDRLDEPVNKNEEMVIHLVKE